MYQINEYALVKETKKIVKIIDKENFDFVKLYYTSDGKAYPENQIENESEEFIVNLMISQMTEEDWTNMAKEMFPE